jgi:hypothetical protein
MTKISNEAQYIIDALTAEGFDNEAIEAAMCNREYLAKECISDEVASEVYNAIGAL